MRCQLRALREFAGLLRGCRVTGGTDLDRFVERHGRLEARSVRAVHVERRSLLLGLRRARYAGHSPPVKHICAGLRRSIIMERFPTARHLAEHLAGFSWPVS